MNPAERSAAIPAVSVRNVSKFFGSADRAVRAVDDVSLDIVDGEFFCLLGPSGSGKTTLLRLIAGFEMPTSGSVFLLGRDVTRLPPFDRDYFRSESVRVRYRFCLLSPRLAPTEA